LIQTNWKSHVSEIYMNILNEMVVNREASKDGTDGESEATFDAIPNPI